MGYLFLAISVISGTVKGFFGKKVSDKTTGLKSAILSNFIRMIFCIPIGLIFILIDGGMAKIIVSKEVLLIAVFSGVSTSVFIVSWLLAVQKSAYTAMDAFLSMGVLVPIVLSGIFYKETVTVSQIIGLGLLLLSVIVMSLYTNQIKQKLSLFSIILLIVVGFSSGITDFTQKIFVHNASDTPASVFNFYIYVFSAITLLVVFLCLKDKKQTNDLTGNRGKEKTATLDKRKVLYIAIMAIFLFCNSYFKTLAASILDAVKIYPLSQGSAIVLSLLMSAIFFKEKIKPLCIIGLIILFVGLIFINVITF